MSVTERIAFGPGGRILEVPENEQLLAQIHAAPILQPADLFKLSSFYRPFPTNEPLANHLALMALLELVESESVQQALTETDMVSLKAASDFSEDYRDGATDERNELTEAIERLYVQWVLFSGIGLLIETPEPLGGSGPHFVIGVSPDPASLPSD